MRGSIFTRSPWLIAPEGYDVSWTRLDDGFFHQRISNPDADGYAQDQASEAQTNEFPWLSNGRSINLSINTPTNQPILLADNYRNLLIIQNTSFVPPGAASTDTAPTLFVSLDGPVVVPTTFTIATVANVGYALAFPPGFGILLDTRVLTNSIYVAYGSFTNSDQLVVVGGVVTYGRTPNSPPLAPGAMAAGGGGGRVFGSTVPGYGGGNAAAAPTMPTRRF